VIEIPAVTADEAYELEGKSMRVGSRTFRIDKVAAIGGQACAIPLLDANGATAAFFRIPKPTVVTQPYIHRTSWLIGQELHRKHKAFAHMPQMWWSTETHGQQNSFPFPFAGTLHGLAKGLSWKAWKSNCNFGDLLPNDGSTRHEPTTKERLALAKSFIQTLAFLECFGAKGFIHGDLSDANLMVDPKSMTVSLIDFDAFIFESPTLKCPRLTGRDSGSKGTTGYIPKWLDESKSPDHHPLGDRFARDILLIELLGFCESDPEDGSALLWTGQDELLDDIADLAKILRLSHLTDTSVFTAEESERPSSFELAQKLNLRVQNNVHRKLAAKPRGVRRTSSSPQPKIPTAKKKKNKSSWRQALLAGDWQKLQALTWQVADRTAIFIGDRVLFFLKKLAICVAAVLATCFWVWLIIFSLLKINLPANLVLAGIVAVTPIWLLLNRDSLNSIFHSIKRGNER